MVVLSTATVNSEWVSREVVKALEVKGARADYRVVPVLRPGIKHTALRLWFPEEPIAVRVEEGPLGLIEAMPELLAALGVREPTDHEPLDTPAARPVAELVLRLSDPRMLAGEGTRRAAATARLVYDPADGGPEIESERFAFIAPLGPIEADDLTWYLERYYRWPIGVFRERAAGVEAQLPGWGRKLYTAAVEHEKAQQVFGAVEAQTDPLAGRVAAVARDPAQFDRAVPGIALRGEERTRVAPTKSGWYRVDVRRVELPRLPLRSRAASAWCRVRCACPVRSRAGRIRPYDPIDIAISVEGHRPL